MWLASWYPSRVNPFDGDFIQRHARAVSGCCKVQVIYVVKDATRSVTAGREEIVNGNLTEWIIYYQSPQTGIKILDRFLSQRKYNRLYRAATREYIEANGKPDLVNVHIAMKAGLIALWIQKRWGIPFIVSEQWGAYLPEADKRIEDLSFLYRMALERVIRKAAMITVVSHHLGKAIQKHFPGVQYRVIQNVVDTDTFFPLEKMPGDKLQLIHVSNMNYQKNTEAILQALQILNKTHPDFEIDLFGTPNSALVKLISVLGLEDKAFLKGEMPHPQLAKAMQAADALILYSRFETFGCVLIEANACGIPVIVSDLEVFHDLITENMNGIFVKGEDPAELAKKLLEFIEHKNVFNKKEIATITAKKYNFGEIGSQFLHLYNQVLSSR